MDLPIRSFYSSKIKGFCQIKSPQLRGLCTFLFFNEENMRFEIYNISQSFIISLEQIK